MRDNSNTGFIQITVSEGKIMINDVEVTNITLLNGQNLTSKHNGNGYLYIPNVLDSLNNTGAENGIKKPEAKCILFPDTNASRTDLYNEIKEVNNIVIKSLDYTLEVNSLIGGIPSPTLPSKIATDKQTIQDRIDEIDKKIEELI